MCNSPYYSNRDLFFFVNDCSILQPLHDAINVLLILEAFGSLSYGVYQYKKRKRKELAVSAILLGIFWILNYGIILGQNITYADRNWGLNIIHAIALSQLYINANLHSLRHLEVTMKIDQLTESKSSLFYPIIKKSNFGILIVSIIAQFLRVIIPTALPQLDFLTIMGAVTIVFFLLGLTPRIVFAYELKQIVSSMRENNRGFYDPVIGQLDRQLKSFLFLSPFLVFTINLPWILVPSWRKHSYIVYNLWIFIVSSLGIANLRDTAAGGDASKGESSSSKVGTKLSELTGGQERSINNAQTRDTQLSTIILEPSSKPRETFVFASLVGEENALLESTALESPSKASVSIPSPQRREAEESDGQGTSTEFAFQASNRSIDSRSIES